MKRNLFLIIAYLAGIFIVTEIYLRNFVMKMPAQEIIPGLGLVPVKDSYAVWGVEGMGITHYFGNGELYTPYSGVGESIVVLGDSYTEALQINDDEKYVSVAETLVRQSGWDVDLHNFSQSGRSIADYVYISPVVQDLFHPAIVVFQIETSDFLQSFDKSRTNYFAVTNGVTTLVHQNDFEIKNTFDLNTQNEIKKLSVGSFLIYKFNTVADDLRVKSSFTRNDNTAAEENAPPITAPEMIRMGLDAIRSTYPDSEIIFLVIPTTPQIVNGELSWVNIEDKNLIDLLRMETDSVVIYPSSSFFQLYKDALLFPRGFFNTLPNSGHLNANGHQVIGSALADTLEEILK